MDVDGPGPSNDILFSSEATKGKRSAANLPVEAEDSLPWYVACFLSPSIYPPYLSTCVKKNCQSNCMASNRVEKYRPVSLDDVSGHQDILATINKFVETNRLPHLLLYGPPGTGKTSTILALARRIYGASNVRQMVLELNASDDRGIDVVREQIKTFASTKQIFSMGGTGAAKSGSIAGYKLIILDEADAMTSTAQMALRRIMEKYTANTRFCIIANYAHKLSPALLSRCTRFRFSPLKEADIRVLVEKVVEEETVKIANDAVDALVKLSKGDMRRALNVLQACHASSELFPCLLYKLRIMRVLYMNSFSCRFANLMFLTQKKAHRYGLRTNPSLLKAKSRGRPSQQRLSTHASQHRHQRRLHKS